MSRLVIALWLALPLVGCSLFMGEVPWPPPPAGPDASFVCTGTDETACAGNVCAKTATDGANCGRCGNACPTGTTCKAGACVCPAGQDFCTGHCMDVTSDSSNCGKCGTACTAPKNTCINSVCDCPTAKKWCTDQCADIATDPANCGDCGTNCAMSAPKTACVASKCACPDPTHWCTSTCADWTTDSSNCGACGTKCTKGDTCFGSNCTPDYEWANWTVQDDSPVLNNYTVGTDGTTTDFVTGLVWQQQAYAVKSTWAEAKAYCNNLVLAGKKWRLPTIIELLSIVDYGKTAPAINTTAFPSTPIDNFWSATSSKTFPGSAWTVAFGVDGTDIAYDVGATTKYSVRCVYTPGVSVVQSNPGAPPGRYSTVGSASATAILDAKTSLLWQSQADTPTHPYDTYCQTLNCGGYGSGWRVPTLKELLTLMDWRSGSSSSTTPAIDTTAFPGPYAPGDLFWTSADNASAVGRKWGVSFATSVIQSITASSARVRCVHAGP